MHIKQEAVAGAQRMMLLLINREIYIKLLSQDIYSKAITEKNTTDDLNVFPMALNIRMITMRTVHELSNGEESN